MERVESKRERRRDGNRRSVLGAGDGRASRCISGHGVEELMVGEDRTGRASACYELGAGLPHSSGQPRNWRWLRASEWARPGAVSLPLHAARPRRD